MNNVLFELKNDQIGPESGLIIPIVSIIFDRELGPIPFNPLQHRYDGA